MLGSVVTSSIAHIHPSSRDAKVQDFRNVIDRLQINQEGYEIDQFRVVNIVEPARDGNSMRWMKDITRRRIVNDDDALKVSSELTQILDIVSHVVEA